MKAIIEISDHDVHPDANLTISVQLQRSYPDEVFDPDSIVLQAASIALAALKRDSEMMELETDDAG